MKFPSRLRLPALKLRGRILSISAITLLAMGLIAAIFVTQKSAIDALTAAERAEVEQVRALTEYGSHVGAAFDAVKALVLTPSQALLDELNADMAALTEAGTSVAIAPDLRAQLDAASPMVPMIIEEMTALGLAEDQGLLGQFRASVHEMETILEGAMAADSTIAGAMVQVLTMRRHEKDFMLRVEPAYIDMFQDTYSAFNAEVAAAEIDAQAKSHFLGLMDAYRSDFVSYAQALLKARTDLAALDAQVAIIKEGIAAAQQDAAAERDAISARLERQWGVFNFTLYGTIGLAAALALGLSLLIGKSITRPINRLAATMDRIAEGELDSDVEGTGRNDEIGEMARAVEVFRQNGLRIEQMNADERQRQALTASRAAAMTQLIGSLGVVVQASVRGDFSQRVALETAETDLAEVAENVNALVDTVERGISETGDVLAALAEADLTRRVSGEYEGAFLKLKSDTNAVADKLTDIVGRLRATSRTLKTATGEILEGANDLSERTTKQAATIEETSAAIEQLSATVADNAGKAEAANAMTLDASRIATEGGEVMGRATQAMERITNSSSKISSIIGMIDDIAFQTNLLALNASVEAARAGEAGKGFAVVAVEVRRLAQSAAQASSEVKALIDQSAREVTGGSHLVAEAAEKLSAILASVRQNSALMKEIASASREQASGIGEVTIAVRQMDEMTQHNAALVEETNAAIEQTESQASELDRIVDIFRIDAAPAARTATTRAYRSHGNAAIDADWDAL